MTHKDIRTKFLIEYDKDAAVSSYPSLTDYEIATILDKAYLALIAQKLTGNNQRKVPFEGDIKAIEDVRPLLTTNLAQRTDNVNNGVQNQFTFKFDFGANKPKLLYFIQATLQLYKRTNSIDADTVRINTVKLISHDDAQNFYATSNNTPWIENPVMYIEDDKAVVLYDKYEYNKNPEKDPQLAVTYVRIPNSFVADKTWSQAFELNESMAEELINLAVLMSLEVVESTRLQAKAGERQLEA